MHLKTISKPKVPLFKDKFRLFQVTWFRLQFIKLRFRFFQINDQKFFKYPYHHSDNSYLLTWEERICLGILKFRTLISTNYFWLGSPKWSWAFLHVYYEILEEAFLKHLHRRGHESSRVIVLRKSPSYKYFITSLLTQPGITKN